MIEIYTIRSGIEFYHLSPSEQKLNRYRLKQIESSGHYSQYVVEINACRNKFVAMRWF